MDIQSLKRTYKMNATRIAKCGNSLAIRIPANIAKALALKEGDEVLILPSSEGFSVTKDESKAKALKTIASFKGRLDKNFKFKRDEVNET